MKTILTTLILLALLAISIGAFAQDTIKFMPAYRVWEGQIWNATPTTQSLQAFPRANTNTYINLPFPELVTDTTIEILVTKMNGGTNKVVIYNLHSDFTPVEITAQYETVVFIIKNRKWVIK